MTLSKAALLFLALPVMVSVTNAQAGESIPDRYIVQVKEGVNPRTVGPAHGMAPDYVYDKAVHGFAGFVPPGKLAALQADPRVERVIPDRAVVAFGKPGSGGGGVGGQVVPAGVSRIGAAPGGAFNGAGVGVAVVDTGIDFNHADLLPAGASFSAFGGTAQDDNGHGTHVSGIIAAVNNGLDVVGVAPSATLYAVKVLDRSGSGSDSAVIAGLNWIATNPENGGAKIRVVNMSLGRVGTVDDNPVLHAAIQALTNSGITMVVAAGNDSSLEVSQQVPSTYPEVIAVASTTALSGTNQYRFYNGFIAADTASYFTSDGAFNSTTGIGVTISAPGEDQENISKAGGIESIGILSTKLGGGTTRLSGTSMASPHTAGVAALLYQQNSLVTPDLVRAKLRSGAANISSAPLNSPVSGYSFDGEREGVLSVPGALTAP